MPVVIPLFRGPFWGVTDTFGLVSHGCYSFLYFLSGFLFAGVRKNTGRHFKGFYFIKNT